MKTLYVPKGRTVCYKDLYVDSIVVHGILTVKRCLRARKVTGRGHLLATEAWVDEVCCSNFCADYYFGSRMAIAFGSFKACRVSESIAVSDYIEADSLKAARLTVTQSDISAIDVNEVIHLKPQKRSLMGVLLRGMLRRIGMALTGSYELGTSLYDPEWASQKGHEQVQTHQDDTLLRDNGIDIPADPELEAIVKAYHAVKANGFTVEIKPNAKIRMYRAS